MHYIKIKKAALVPDAHGQHIAITMIGLWKKQDGQEVDKFVKWIKLTPEILDGLIAKKFSVTDEQARRFSE